MKLARQTLKGERWTNLTGEETGSGRYPVFDRSPAHGGVMETGASGSHLPHQSSA